MDDGECIGGLERDLVSPVSREALDGPYVHVPDSGLQDAQGAEPAACQARKVAGGGDIQTGSRCPAASSSNRALGAAVGTPCHSFLRQPIEDRRTSSSCLRYAEALIAGDDLPLRHFGVEG